MRIALIDALRAALPNCHITLTTPFPGMDEGAYTCDEMVKCSRRSPATAAVMLARAFAWNVLRRAMGWDVQVLLTPEMRHYTASDIVVDVSGDGLTEEYGTRCLLSHFVPLVLARLLRKPLFLCAQTIGPFNRHRAISRWVLDGAAAITAREDITLSYLRKLGLSRPDLALTADLAFLMQPAPRDRVEQILEREGVPTDRPLVGFSVSRLPGHLYGTTGSEEPSILESAVATAIDRAVEMGLTPVIISHTIGPGSRRDDRRAAYRVAELARNSDRVFMIRGNYTAQETKGIISGMDMMVGQRMHSCIAAISTGVPTVSIAYGPKAFGIMRLAGQNEWVTDMREVSTDNLAALVESAWNNRESLKRSLRENAPKIARMAEENVHRIVRCLETAKAPTVRLADLAVSGSAMPQESSNVSSS